MLLAAGVPVCLVCYFDGKQPKTLGQKCIFKRAILERACGLDLGCKPFDYGLIDHSHMSRPDLYILPGRAAAFAVAILAILQLSCLSVRAQILRLRTITHPPMKESSGLAASKRYPGVIWSHADGDGGRNKQFLFAMRTNGAYINAFQVAASFIDWEDIAADGEGNLYLADTGSDGISRSHVKIHRVREPNPDNLKKVQVERTWYARFPGRRQNCEAFFVLGGRGYLVTKGELAGRVAIYDFALAARAESILLQRVTTVDIPGDVTAATISSDSSRLALLTDDGPVVYMINGDVSAIRSSVGYHRPFRNTLIEGATFAGDGLLVSSEAGELFLFTDPQFQTR
jgi:hypothetical protein